MTDRRWIVLAVALGACGGNAEIGAFGEDAFYVTQDHYRVEYGESRRLLPGAWVIDNFQLRDDGTIGDAKRTRPFRRVFGLDHDDDGRVDRRVRAYRYDLRFQHRADASVFWVQSFPVSSRASQRRLDVVARDFVDRVGGGSYFEVDLGVDAVREREVGTVIREEGPIRVDGVPGYLATFDIVSLAQREVNAAHVGERVTVAILRPRALWHADPRAYRSDDDDGQSMLVVIGLAARAELHAQHRPELEDLLRRVDFRETD